MTDIFHICMTAHHEVLFRSPEDFREITNLIALSAFRDKVKILVDALMSNHMHLIVFSDNPQKFALSLRYSITKHFNKKYHRTGRLFDRKVFISQLVGQRHIIMAVNYVLKNPVHHGQTLTPYSYENCTANYLFACDRGIPKPALLDYTFDNYYMPKNANLSSDFKFGPDGMIFRDSFEEIKLVESFYLTPNTFIYNMNRKTSDEWVKEQELDEVKEPPITLELIEKGVRIDTLKQMLKNENRMKTGHQDKSDTEVCQLIDNQLIVRYNAASVYCLDVKRRLQIAVELLRGYHIGVAQAARCAVVPTADLENERRNIQGLIRSK